MSQCLCGHGEWCKNCRPKRPIRRVDEITIKRLLEERLGFTGREIKLKFSDEKYEPASYVLVEFPGPLTFQMLKEVSQFFETDEIDIEGRHGEDSYDFGLEVELKVENPRVRP